MEEPWDICVRNAKKVAWKLSYDRKIEFLRAHDWTTHGHWDTWFDPRNGWSYSLLGAVEHEMAEQEFKTYDTH